MTGRRALVVFSLEPWDEVWRRNQYLVDGLLRADPALRVLFVEPARDLLHAALHGHPVRRGRGLRVASGYGGRLGLFEPSKWMPRLAGPTADALLRRAVHGAAQRHGADDGVVWVNDPGWAHYLRRGRTEALYDVTDDWTAAHRSRRQHHHIVRNEDALLQLCREVVVCSVGLQERIGQRRSVRLIPNAVDVARYRAACERPSDLPPGRTAVYAGTLHEDRLDVALAARTAERLREAGATFVLVGPDALGAAHTARLVASGAQLLGARPFAQVPAYLQHASALVVPHVVDGFTDSLDPLKLYEYRAVGRPIVSTPVAGFRSLNEPGVVAVSPPEFADAVVAAVTADSATRERPEVPDWSERAAAMGEVVDRLLSARSR